MKMTKWLRRHPLFGFLALTFIWSWTCWLLSSEVKSRSSALATVLMFAGSFGPSMAAIAVVSVLGGRGGLRAWFARCLRWRIGWRWLALALFLPAAMSALAEAAHHALGGTVVPSPAVGHEAMTLLNFFLIFLLGGPLGEELGWRGVALPILQQRFDWRIASVALGVVWGVWHLPLFFIAGTVQAQIPPALFLLSIVAMSVVFAWLVNHTAGSVVAVLLLHTAINFWPSIIPVLPSVESERPYALLVVMLALLALGLLTRPGVASAKSHW